MPDLSIFFEDYVYEKAVQWMRNEHWFMIKSLVAYVITIFGIQMFMHNRKAFQLDRALSVWNSILAVFSSLGVIFITPALYRVIRDYGISCKHSQRGCTVEPEFRYLYPHHRIGNWTSRILAVLVVCFKDSR